MATIDSLDIQISTSLGQSADKIQSLADSLGNLKNQGKIGAATSAMKSLAKALDVLNPSLNALNPAKLQQLRAVMSGLSAIQKPSGLNSAVNALKKLPEVLNGLDDSTLVKLEMQMNRLSRAIAPLATEIDKIGTGFSKLPKKVTQVVNATNKMAKATANATAATKAHNGGINSTSLNLMSVIHNFESMMHVANLVTGALQSTMAQSMEWDGIQYRFGRAFGEDAEETYAYIQKINDALGINIQQFMQYSSLYGSLLSGFGLAQDKVTTISVGLTELSYDIWAAYNDRFKTLEDASEAVRSAITGEIEPIRNAGIALTEASLQEYLDDIGMTSVSIEKLSEAQKAEVRYAAMMEAAMNQGIVGTYAGEMQTAEGAVRNLSQAFKTLTQAFGSLFIPLLQAAIPYVTAFVNLLTEAVHWIANLFNLTLFEIDWGDGISEAMRAAQAGADDVESGFGKAAKAAKKIRDYTMGFDELNIIAPPSESSGGGGGSGASGVNWGSGLDLKTLWDDSVFAKASQQVDELKEKIKVWFEEWKTEIAIVAGALGVLSIASLLGSLGEAIGLGDKFVGVMGTIKKLAATALVITIQYALTSELLGDFVEEGSWKDYLLALVVSAIGTGILYSQWGAAGIVIGLGVTAVASFKATFEDGDVDSMEEVVTGLTGLASAIGAIATAAGILKKTDLGSAIKLLLEGNSLGAVLSAWFPNAATVLSTASTWVTGTLVPAITSAITTGLGTIATALGVSVGWAAAIVAAVVAAIVGAVWAIKNWDKVKKFFTESVPEWFSGVKQAVVNWWKNIDIAGSIRGAMGKATDWFSGVREDVKKYWDGVVATIDNIDWAGLGYDVGQKVGTAFKDAKNWFNETKKAITDSWNKFWKTDFPKFFKETIPQTIEKIRDSWNKFWKEKVPEFLLKMASFFLVEFPTWKAEMKKIGKDIVNGIGEGIEGAWNSFWKGVKEWISGFVKGFKDALGIKSPSKVFASIGKYIIEGLLSGITGKWKELTNWFKTTVAPKLTLDYWKKKFNNIVSAIKSKWSEARSWWSSSKPSLATVQAKVASVKEKLSSAWSTARTWWNNSKAKLSNVSVTVDSIKTKLVSAWNTAKEWFNKQSMKLNIKTPHFSVGWNYNISSTMATIADFLFDKRAIPKINVSWYAQGGFPGTSGELFVANEAGPELVGKIGNRNAVVNNDQIVAAVSEGVYAAVVAAMKASANQGDGGRAVNVYLDGKQITSAVEQRQRERGATLMGTQVFSY